MLRVDASADLVTPDVLFALQPRIDNEHLLPRLDRFLWKNTTVDFIPSIPLSLSPRTAAGIAVGFISDPPTVVLAFTIVRFPTPCPRMKYLVLKYLPRNPTITEAVSEMFLACNRDTLQWF